MRYDGRIDVLGETNMRREIERYRSFTVGPFDGSAELISREDLLQRINDGFYSNREGIVEGHDLSCEEFLRKRIDERTSNELNDGVSA